MASTYCLPKNLSLEFKRRLKSREIEPDKLAAMTSEARHKYFASFLGEENATNVNSLFESKLLLKSQRQGMVNWAKAVSGIKPTTRKTIIEKISTLDKVLNPTEQKAFLADLAEKKLGIGVAPEEAKKIFELSKDAAQKKATLSTSGDRLAYGRALVKANNYLNDLRIEAEKPTITQRIKNPTKIVSDIGGAAKSLKASFDDSAIFRQGWKSLWTNPGIWSKNALRTFSDAVKTFGGKPVMDEINADIISRPNSVNGFYKRAGLAVANVEEAFPSTLPERVPLLGRVYKASENAYTGFVYRQRADIFDKYIEIAERSGVDVTDEKELKSIGRLVNSLTGRGHLGKAEPAANTFNNIFFSPRKLKADIDGLTLHALDSNFSGFARKQAAINLLKQITGIAAIIGTARAIKPDSVELDPRSADFGKIKIGDTRFDVTAGQSSLITLAARLLTMSSKSSTTGKVKKLNSGKFGAQTGLDVVYNFLENKQSPILRVVTDLLKGKDFDGNKPTLAGEAKNLFMPLPVTNYEELKKNPNSANIIVALIADALGISTNTY